MITFLLIALLEVDDQVPKSAHYRSWTGVREFFKQIVPEVERQEELKNSDNGKDRLLAAVLSEVIETLYRELGEMNFFAEILGQTIQLQQTDECKMKYAPLKNLGCESKFAKLDNRISFNDGSTSIATHSRKSIVATNRFLVDSSFTGISDDKRQNWKWRRNALRQETKMEVGRKRAKGMVDLLQRKV